MKSKVRHVCGLSGGKDSTALAIYMRDRVPDMEYFFCDTGAELPETYEFLDKLEAFLGKKIQRLNSGKTFDYWLELYSGYLPSPKARWCTKVMKLIPLENYLGEDECISYVGIRADENREGHLSKKPNIKAVFPFKEDGIVLADINRILSEAGIGLPKYYEWRSRSGCYFCFFQQKQEWMGLKNRHPELFEKAKKYEKIDPKGKTFTWVAGQTLGDLEKDETSILRRAKERSDAKKEKKETLFEIFGGEKEEDEVEGGCDICHL